VTRIAEVAGLTLVEVLAALVLLAILGGTVVPVLIAARQAMVEDAPTVSRDALEKFADDWLASKEGSTLTSNAIDLERDLKTDAGVETVRIRSIGPASESAGHVWLTFERAGTTVLRCAEVESDGAPAEAR
jgi:type II secretory pathway pseudopilin PulG